MVKKTLEELKNQFKDIDASEMSYDVKGYHIAIDTKKGSLVDVVDFLYKKGFYLTDLFCVDYIEYLELVYLFNTHRELCRTKVTLKVEPEKPSAPTISHIYTIAHWYEREIH